MASVGDPQLEGHFIINSAERFRGMKLMVIGDIGLDEYVTGRAQRLSPEAPVPVLEVSNQGLHLGLSGNVANNIKSLGGEPYLISVVGSDYNASRLRELLQMADIRSDFLLTDDARPTTHKVRVMAQQHHLVRIDYETQDFLPGAVQSKLLSIVNELLPNCSGVILQDYAKGVLSPGVIEQIVRSAHSHGKRVLLDPHRKAKLSHYLGIDLMTPNHEEAAMLAGMSLREGESDSSLDVIGKKIMSSTHAERLVITRGKKGMRLFEGNKRTDLPTYARQVFDVTGAGDTVISMLALAWLSGHSLEQACVAANYAAGVVVGKVGCVPCTIKDLKEYFCPGNTRINAHA